jgi:hypothetical protein
MGRMLVVCFFILGASWVGCSRGKCDDRDMFGQKVDRSPEKEAECNNTDQASNQNDGGASDTGAGGGNTGGGNGGGTTGGGPLPDTVAPSVTLFARDVSQAWQTSALPIVFKVSFSEVIDPVTFSSADITNVGTATAVVWRVTNSGDSKNFIISTTNSGFGTLQPRIVMGSFTDVAGNVNAVSADSSNSVNFVLGPLTMTINQAPYQIDPDEIAPIDFVVVFSRPINPATFTSADVVNVGTSTGISWQVAKQDDLTWYIAANSVSVPGTVIPVVSAGMIADSLGNLNEASTGQDGSVTYQPNP